jgi:hypothetical protein
MTKNILLFIVGFIFTIGMFWLGGYDFSRRNIETVVIIMLGLMGGWSAIELWKEFTGRGV